MNSFDSMGLSIEDFTWYPVGQASELVERNIPQIVNEFIVDGDALTIMIINELEVPSFNSFRMAFWFRGAYLPVYENGDFYIKVDGSLAARKRSDGSVVLGVRNES